MNEGNIPSLLKWIQAISISWMLSKSWRYKFRSNNFKTTTN